MACRPAYAVSLGLCIFSYLCSRFVVTWFPNTVIIFKYIFRLSLLGGGIGIALCQPDLRSITLFAVAIISPSIFIDSMMSSFIVHISALILYIFMGRNVISPEVYSWGLGNYILFSIFGLLIGLSINRARFERYIYAEYETKLAEAQMQFAYFDRLTGLRNRRAYEEKLLQLQDEPQSEFCVIMADINGLKTVNDTIGHNAGDELITGASKCLSEAFDGINTIYRIGGDEFCIIMPASAEKTCLCLSRLEELFSNWRGRYVNSLSVSVGVASSKDHEDVESVVAEADKKMYDCKRNYPINRSGKENTI